MMYKYFVVVDHPDYKDEVHYELQAYYGDYPIPQRSVTCVDPMEPSHYCGMFLLTQEEADHLIGDLRIRDVHRIPEEIGVKLKPLGSRSGPFSKNAIASYGNKNWALSRVINQTNNFGSAASTSSQFTYNLDGTGVDIIVVDTGVEQYHPEFAVNADGSGGTRVVNHDWSQYGYLSVPTGGFLGDCDGHGSNCASIAAGNTHGWAPNAKIYSLRCIGTGAAQEVDITDGRNLDLLDIFSAFYSIYAFHLSKIADPVTGYVRPTIVSNSWAYYTAYTTLTAINYRGVNHTVSTTTAAYGTIGVPEGGYGTHGYRYTALESVIQQCINAGVIVTAAAGNDCHKIDVAGGQDYGNYWTEKGTGYQNYYHRGATPGACPGVICVGAVATAVPERKASFSCTGPRVDIFAPGYSIMGAYSNQAYVGNAVADPRSSASTSSGATYYQNAISGTSQACPQVTGVLANFLQLRPYNTATTCRNWLRGVANLNQLNQTVVSADTSSYTNFQSLHTALNAFMYMPYNLPNPLTVRL